MKRKIIKYLVELINYLDGRGLVLTDESLLKETLSSDFGGFKILKRMIKGG